MEIKRNESSNILTILLIFSYLHYRYGSTVTLSTKISDISNIFYNKEIFNRKKKMKDFFDQHLEWRFIIIKKKYVIYVKAFTLKEHYCNIVYYIQIQCWGTKAVDENSWWNLFHIFYSWCIFSLMHNKHFYPLLYTILRNYKIEGSEQFKILVPCGQMSFIKDYFKIS